MELNNALVFRVIALLFGVVCLYSGYRVYKENREATGFNNVNIFIWLLYALGAAFMIFGLFPESSAAGEFNKVQVGGALAAFLVIWSYGTWRSNKAQLVDQLADQNKLLKTENKTSKEELADRDKKIADLSVKLKNMASRPNENVIPNTQILRFKLVKSPEKQIAIIAGDFRTLKNADAWVNSENTNMQMARYYEQSVSGIVRYMGAVKDQTGDVIEDIIANELSHVMGKKLYVQPATVLVTSPGELTHTHNVKKILHVAAVQGEVGFGYRPVQNIEACVINILDTVNKPEMQADGIHSLLLPVLGTGNAGGDYQTRSQQLVTQVIECLENPQYNNLDVIYIPARTDVRLEILQEILEDTGKVTKA